MRREYELFPEQKYCIDSSSLIDLHKYYPSTSRDGILRPMWDKLEDMTKQGLLVSSVEVRRELNDKEVIEWYKKNSMQFFPVYSDHAALFEKIKPHYTPQNFKRNISDTGPWADPVIIAMAAVEKMPLVTNEGTKSSNGIPAIADKLGVKTMNLIQFLAEIGFKL